MSDIKKALEKFVSLSAITYQFVLAYKKNLQEINLTFRESDFYHLTGMHYLKDIDIPRHYPQLLSKINTRIIDDDYLAKSAYYQKADNNYANVQKRIQNLQILEDYLDNPNLICKYIKQKNIYSKIQADYLIKSTLNHITAYIFLKKRRNEEEYCVCSFFVEPQTDYQGEKVYWLYKAKLNLDSGEKIILYNRLE